MWGWDREDSIPPPPPVRQALDAPPGRRKENTTDLIYFTTPILPPSLGLKRELVKSEILLWVGGGGGVARAHPQYRGPRFLCRALDVTIIFSLNSSFLWRLGSKV